MILMKNNHSSTRGKRDIRTKMMSSSSHGSSSNDNGAIAAGTSYAVCSDDAYACGIVGEEESDNDDAGVEVELAPGETLLFSSTIEHRSGVNSSSTPRRVFYAQYSPTIISPPGCIQSPSERPLPISFAVPCIINEISCDWVNNYHSDTHATKSINGNDSTSTWQGESGQDSTIDDVAQVMKRPRVETGLHTVKK
jgi:hypothetical protein